MKIVVLVKEVPDTYGDRKLSLETGLADRAASERVLDEIGERALEVALSYADANPGTEVQVVSMASEDAAATVRKGLAMGAASALQVVDPGLAGADLGVTARVLAAAVQRAGFDLVITGNLSTDGSGVLPAMLAEHLGVAQATALSAVTIGDGSRARAPPTSAPRRSARRCRGHLDHRGPARCPVPELQGHHGGEEEAVRDRVARRPRRRRRPGIRAAVDHDGGREAPRGRE
jgi:hypothetical protein